MTTSFRILILKIIGLLLLFGCSQSVNKTIPNQQSEVLKEDSDVIANRESRIKRDSIKDYSALTDQDWKNILTSKEYYILREKGTERAFSGDYVGMKKKGTYLCKGCETPLFQSDTKFSSGTGWPSFYDFIKGNIEKIQDNSFGMNRVEVVCAVCKGHQGHVFTDGPNPTGLRYCINSESLLFKENK